MIQEQMPIYRTAITYQANLRIMDGNHSIGIHLCNALSDITNERSGTITNNKDILLMPNYLGIDQESLNTMR